VSVVYFGSELQSLAAKLADQLAEQERHGDFFAPAAIVVPNRHLRKWLQLWLARRLGVCINLQFQYLEDALWELLREVDPRKHATQPESLDENAYRLLVLSALLEDDDPDLAVLRSYIQLGPPPLTRLSCRRAWHLADRMGTLIRDYEYARQDALIQRWLRREIGLANAGEFTRSMERAQRALFERITDPDVGRRSILARRTGKNYKTFPQYAMEVMELPRATIGPERRIHVFGLTQANALHMRVLHWLGAALEVRLYHPNVLASRLGATPTAEDILTAANTVRDPARAPADTSLAADLLRPWARAGSEALALMAGLLGAGYFKAEVLDPVPAHPMRATVATSKKPAVSVLGRLQDHLLGRARRGAARLPQDRSLQIVGCPGIVREVETVYNSILDNLQNNPGLRQTDIVVLATDMARYRPALQAVFERPPHPLRYSLVDYSAAGLSMFGQALLGMLDLALESFTRSRVFEVLLNPCFLARLGVDRSEALAWLQWAETLGICQGWDAEEKYEQGYPRSPFYAWRLALQRLRLGRYMEVYPEDDDEPAPRFNDVIPFADINSTDREQLDAFCRSVESLLPTLAGLRRLHGTGQRWAAVLQRLAHEFLDVPDDRPEEEQVRNHILAAVDQLALWDDLRPTAAAAVLGPSSVVRGKDKTATDQLTTDDGRRTGLSLPLVREFLLSQLEALPARRAEYLTGGVTLAALQPMRPIPFQLIYVIGLDADLFPGSNRLSSFDLRSAGREPGDIRPAENNAYLLLENLIAAHQKVYLLYNNRDLQKDRAILPSAPLQQLVRYLGEHVTAGEFKPIAMPVHGDDDPFFDRAQQPDYQDVLVQYHEADRYLAFSAARNEGRLVPDLHQQADLRTKMEKLQVDFAIAAELPPSLKAPVTVSVWELSRFLKFPAAEILRRHLRIEDEREESTALDEPLVTPDLAMRQLVRMTLSQLVRRAAAGEVQKALEEWPARFRAAFADARLRSRVPEDAFGDIDEEAIRRELDQRIHGLGEFAPFLRRHAQKMSCGPALLGETLIPIGAKMRFPALRLRPGHELPADGPEIRVVGSTPFAWFNRDTFDILVLTTSTKKFDAGQLHAPMLEPLLFYLALLANPEPNGKAIAAKDWLSRRHFTLHLAHPAGIQTWAYPIGLIAPDEAQQYLTMLAGELLDPTQLDLLPFDLIAREYEFRRAYDETSPSQVSAEEYVSLLKDKVADERENPWSSVHIPLVVEMAGASIPVDALSKVQRRFRLLDRGPALRRREWEEGS
jgi:exonuclease V gamma subunit